MNNPRNILSFNTQGRSSSRAPAPAARSAPPPARSAPPPAHHAPAPAPAPHAPAPSSGGGGMLSGKHSTIYSDVRRT